MIKRVKELDSKALIASKEFRDYVEKQETEINRGISVLCILSILTQAGEEGLHGYKILKDLTDQTNEMLIIEEGTIYPILRKLEEENIIKSKREESGRRRKFYSVKVYGKKIFNHLAGYYSKLTEAIAPLFDVNVNLKSEKYLFCPMCANKIELANVELRFCDVCGHNIEKELKERGLKNE
ncbi:MAG: helix-turn-helix transcriptional regulator [Candidatus Lokiarchaeota archaeon]|nr:helix-turn-helix transcriptional regulator [Candidatus Lokiarchaeota archaeon]